MSSLVVRASMVLGSTAVGQERSSRERTDSWLRPVFHLLAKGADALEVPIVAAGAKSYLSAGMASAAPVTSYPSGS